MQNLTLGTSDSILAPSSTQYCFISLSLLYPWGNWEYEIPQGCNGKWRARWESTASWGSHTGLLPPLSCVLASWRILHWSPSQGWRNQDKGERSACSNVWALSMMAKDKDLAWEDLHCPASSNIAFGDWVPKTLGKLFNFSKLYFLYL